MPSLSGRLASEQRPPLWIFIPLVLLPLGIGKLTFLIAAGFGMLTAFRRKPVQIKPWALTYSAVIALLLWTGNWYENGRVVWSQGAISATPWLQRLLPLLAMSSPLAYLTLTNSTSKPKGPHRVV